MAGEMGVRCHGGCGSAGALQGPETERYLQTGSAGAREGHPDRNLERETPSSIWTAKLLLSRIWKRTS